ncbi:amidohydrolase family protein [Puia dinghuensis]|uniref:Amidohydrolase-related domain-containing protein n=1 Tax=Puia dinghuensis TaxID=1792502 RepID=A0A8J2XPM1_9BACT|nr:amidohydrolase family protein [Puia dinghuensis]GGA81086.1 hypothetical protein GCM10011511_00070 [Puia dinghuensis]
MIDIHSHLAYYKIYSASYLRGMIQNPETTTPRLQGFLNAFLGDKDGHRHLMQMDTAGIDRSVLLIIDSSIGMEPPELDIEDIYRLHSAVQKKHPDRFIVFAGVDPRRKNCYELFVKGIEFYGFRGLKLYPPMGFAMDHPSLENIYEYCQRHRLPVLIHTGDSLDILDKNFSKVKNAIRVAERYPGIPFILAHAGYQLKEPGMSELLGYPNVYFDIAGIQVLLGQKDPVAFDHLDKETLIQFSRKMVFGTDWPLFNLMTPISEHIIHIECLLKKNGLSEEQVKNVFHSDHLIYK